MRASLRFGGFVGLTLLLLPIYLVVRPVSLGAKRAIEALWFSSVLRIVGLKVNVRGKAASGQFMLFAANHVSYLDIMVLGSLLDARFIAKSDVRSWPGIGFLAKISGTCFVRRVATEAAAQNDELAAVLGKGQSLILFAEGTSSDGSKVLPFKSSLFGVVDRAEAIAVQPVAIRYTQLNGLPVNDAAARDMLAWYGDMTLLPHLWTFLGQRGGEVEVHFLVAGPNPREAGRKTVAKMAESAVRGVVE